MKTTKTYSIVPIKSNTKTSVRVWEKDCKNSIKDHLVEYHLYTTSNEEIKEGDWFLDLVSNKLWKYTKEHNSVRLKHWRKIVATTDKSLFLKANCECSESEAIYCGEGKSVGKCQQIIPQLPESFIQAYIKAYNEDKPITEVDLEVEECQTYRDDACNVRFTCCNNSLSIKTRPDNTVIIHQSKMYSRDEVIKLIEGARMTSNSMTMDEFIKEYL